MQPWSNRVVEEANLFNPAFCGVLIAQMSDDYAKKAHHAMPAPFLHLTEDGNVEISGRGPCQLPIADVYRASPKPLQSTLSGRSLTGDATVRNGS